MNLSENEIKERLNKGERQAFYTDLYNNES